jgi:hypothetical protein
MNLININMKELTAEQIQDNWNILLSRIDSYISEPRRTKLKEFYNKYQERIMFMPASHKKEYHNCFIGGYVDHVIRVMDCALKLHNVWVEMGVNTSTYTQEELIFSALNHDLGKIGDENNECYIIQDDEWRKKNLGEEYKHNTAISFSSVPDRGLYLLQSNGIQYSFNEMIAIQTHDGLYDEANKKYYMGYSPETKPRTSLIYILHHADMMAARIEWETDYLDKEGKFIDGVTGFKKDKKSESKNVPTKQKALKQLTNSNFKNIFDTL